MNKELKESWQRRWHGLQVTHHEIQGMSDAVQKWGFDFFLNKKEAPKLFVLTGQSGLGKTHITEKEKYYCSRVAITAWQYGHWPHPPRVMWVEWAQLVNLPSDEFRRWLDSLNDVDCLFCEDVGCEVDKFKSGEPTERLRELLNDFKHRWLFITSNITPDQWPEKWDERIRDRLMRDSTLFTLTDAPRFSLAKNL